MISIVLVVAAANVLGVVLVVCCSKDAGLQEGGIFEATPILAAYFIHL